MLGRPLSSSALGSEQHAGPTTTNSTRVVEASSAIVQRGKGRLHYQKAKANAYRRRGLVGSCERCKLFNTATSRLSLPLGRTFGERGRGRGRGRGADAGKYSCRALQRENAEDSRIRETPIATDPVSKHQYQLVGSRKELIHVVVEESQSAFTVSIRVRNILIGEGTSVSLRWWTFNGTSNLAETKEEYLGACDSTKLAGNAFVSPFTRDSERDGEYFTRLVLRNKTTTSSSGPPATASFAQQLAFNPTYTFEGRPVLSRPREHNYFAIPLGFYPGTPFPLGAHRQDDWVNFTVLSAASTRPKLCFLQLDDKDGNSRGGVRGASIGVEIELDPTLNRTGDLWHCAVKVPKHFDAYAFRMAQVDPTDGYKIGEELLPDPFADDTVEVRVSNNQDREEDSDGDGDGGSGSRSRRPVAFASASLLPPSGAGRGMEEKEEDAFLEAWEEDRPLKHAFSRAVILEMDLHKGEEGEARGDQEGEHVEELNVFEAVLSAALEVEDSGITALAVRGLINEETITSAASVAYGLGSQELKHLVRRLHEMDLELILELDCLKLLSVMRVAHLNEGRAIQSLKAGMRFLVSEYNLDGVCFLHAEKLTHGDFDIVLDRPPIVEDLCNDPVLHSTKLIAVPFGNHLLPREGLRGFPHWGRWAEVNSRFVEDMRNLYLADSRADLTRVSMRLAGSADLFEKWTNGSFHLFAERPPYLGLNSVSFVGELPLSEMKGASVQDAPSTERGGAALVEQKHADSIRWSLISSMMVSQGVPFLRLLDLSHENWPEELALFSRLCEFRERYFDLIQKETFRDPKDVRWHSIDAEAEPEWSSSAESKDGLGNSSFRAEGLSDLPFVAEACHHESKFIGLSIWSDDQMHAVYWAGNGNDTSLQITLPEPTLGHTWKILLDSGRIGLSLSNETLAASEEYPMEAKSSILLTMEKIA